MKNAIILHGTGSKEEYYSLEYPSASNSHWFPWLQKNLIANDILAITPEMRDNFTPDYDAWRTEFERYDITAETVLVGHSCGGGFLVRWLSEHPEVQVGKVVLVAPWLDPENEKENGFFDFVIDPDFPQRTQGVTIFNSDDDMDAVQVSVKEIMEETEGIKINEFHEYGHFCMEDMGTGEFPQLLEEILK